MRRTIQEDDIVSVDFNGAQLTLTHRAKVLYIPCAPGDSWIFRDTDTGRLFDVSEGCTVTLLEKAPPQGEITPPFNANQLSTRNN